MLCERCKQREATVKITRISNGHVDEYHLCEECVDAFRSADNGQAAEWSKAIFKLLTDAVVKRMGSQNNQEENERLRAVVCPNCGKTYGEFLDDNTFGCADCYETFQPYIQQTVLSIQGAGQHTGRKSQRKAVRPAVRKIEEEQLSVEEQLAILQERMQEAVRQEDYEAAAKYRDEMKQLKESGE